MSFIVEDTGGGTDFLPVPPGSHLARCYRIIDLGTQRSEYMGEEKFLRKIMLGWELHGEAEDGSPLKTEKGDPMAIFKNYTLSWGEKANLRIDLQSWRGKPWSEGELKRFDVSAVLGQWCLLNVIQKPGKNQKIYANVSGVSPVPSIYKKAGFPEAVNELQLFRLADPDMVMFEKFSKGLKTKIESSPEWRSRNQFKPPPTPKPAAQPSSGFDDMDDDIPF
jgi:hypothetical protein